MSDLLHPNNSPQHSESVIPPNLQPSMPVPCCPLLERKLSPSTFFQAQLNSSSTMPSLPLLLMPHHSLPIVLLSTVALLSSLSPCLFSASGCESHTFLFLPYDPTVSQQKYTHCPLILPLPPSSIFTATHHAFPPRGLC